MKTLKTLFLTLTLALLVVAVHAQTTTADKIMSAYLGIKNGLVASNGAAAKTSAAQLLAVLSDSPDKGLKPAQQKVLATYLEKLKFDSRHISETTVVDHQREHFASLSKNLYAVVKDLKLNTTTIYQQYCPMKKEYWLSETTTIKNPYFGTQMLECGKTTETLKATEK